MKYTAVMKAAMKEKPYSIIFPESESGSSYSVISLTRDYADGVKLTLSYVDEWNDFVNEISFIFNGREWRCCKDRRLFSIGRVIDEWGPPIPACFSIEAEKLAKAIMAEMMNAG